MKASESSPRYVGKVRECCNYAVRSAKNFLQNGDAGHRQPGGNGETQLREMLTKDLSVFCDHISEETFSTETRAYFASNFLTFLFMLLSVGLAVLSYFYDRLEGILIASFAFSVLALLAFLGIFGGSSKNMEATNVYAVRKPTGTVKHKVILEANLDAPFRRRFSKGAEFTLRFLTFLGILLYVAFDVVVLLIELAVINFQYDQYVYYLAFALIIFLIFPIILMRAVSTGSSYPGVADNLIGAYTACGAMRYMSEMELRLMETELSVLLTSGKPDKNRGARCFAKDHKAEFDETDTLVLCLDSLYNPETLNAVCKGRKVSQLLGEAAENADVLLTDMNPKYHKGDVRAFQKEGIPAVSITTLPDEKPAFYRNEGDDENNLDVHAVEAAIKLCLETAYRKDEDLTKFQ
ncbi:MAG: M28 family peptidase [Clostridia bacterium]|nr:M28 family peptidase [Clostridia bacterium]